MRPHANREHLFTDVELSAATLGLKEKVSEKGKPPCQTVCFHQRTERILFSDWQTDSLSINILFTVRENNPLSLAQRDTSQMPMEYRAYIYAYVYVCLNMCVKRLYTLPSWAISPWGEWQGDQGMLCGARHIGRMRMAREREENKGVNSLGVQMEMGECDRAFFHECLLKAPGGRGRRGAGSVKVSLQWHVPSGSVLQ